MPAPAMAWNEPSVSATDRHIDWCCCPSRPPLQMAITRGRSSLRRYTSNAARLIEGGGGGARRGSRWWTLVAPGGGGGACVVQSIASATEPSPFPVREVIFGCSSVRVQLRVRCAFYRGGGHGEQARRLLGVARAQVREHVQPRAEAGHDQHAPRLVLAVLELLAVLGGPGVSKARDSFRAPGSAPRTYSTRGHEGMRVNAEIGQCMIVKSSPSGTAGLAPQKLITPWV